MLTKESLNIKYLKVLKRDIDVSELRPYSELYQKHKSNLSQLIITSIFTTRHWINIQIYIEEFSNENFDYFGITDKTLCPLCK
ncbi:hypothetical protein RhiirA4_542500 [Rhizophagus irregularis]|uniref:Uncharacterized protein n=1 Tax=Rhizophagus irregularis TaxID=588596 RepID=A0A2I1GF90_9GLOM|nr:hypothetical protein RhiirA4_542500 [Rhizophagus irregularis]